MRRRGVAGAVVTRPALRRRAATLALLVTTASLVGAPAWAQSSAPGGLRGLLQVRSADPQGRGILEIGAFPRLHWLEDDDAQVHVFTVTDFQLAYGPSPYLELAVAAPLRTWRVDAAAGSTVAPTSLVGFGDLVTRGKLQLPLPWKTLRLGGCVAASLPTGSRSRGMSSETTDVEAGGLLTVDLTELQRFVPTRLHVSAGYRWNRNEADGVGMAPLDSLREGGFWPPAYPPVPPGEPTTTNDHLFLRAGLEFTTRTLDLFTEYGVDLLPGIESVQLEMIRSGWTQTWRTGQLAPFSETVIFRGTMRQRGLRLFCSGCRRHDMRI